MKDDKLLGRTPVEGQDRKARGDTPAGLPDPPCPHCGGSGILPGLEYVLRWKHERNRFERPANCSRRVASEEEGLERMADLGEADHDAEVISGVRVCSCRQKKQGVTDRHDKGKTLAPQQQNKNVDSNENPNDIVIPDYKMRQAGDK